MDNMPMDQMPGQMMYGDPMMMEMYQCMMNMNKMMMDMCRMMMDMHRMMMDMHRKMGMGDMYNTK